MTNPADAGDQPPGRALTRQQQIWQKQGYPASLQIRRVTRDEDGNVVSTEEEPEQPLTAHPITPEEFYRRTRGGKVKRKMGGKVEGEAARRHLGRRARGTAN